jgi:hypothetical protein
MQWSLPHIEMLCRRVGIMAARAPIAVAQSRRLRCSRGGFVSALARNRDFDEPRGSHICSVTRVQGWSSRFQPPVRGSEEAATVGLAFRGIHMAEAAVEVHCSALGLGLIHLPLFPEHRKRIRLAIVGVSCSAKAGHVAIGDFEVDGSIVAHVSSVGGLWKG